MVRNYILITGENGKIRIDLNEAWNESLKLTPEFNERLLHMTGGDIDKAKRTFAFLMEVLDDYPDGRVPSEVVMEKAKELQVVDKIIRDLLEIFANKYGNTRVIGFGVGW